MTLQLYPTSITTTDVQVVVAANSIITADAPWEINNIRLILTTSGTVGTRKAQVLFKAADGTTFRTVSWASTGATASTGTTCETGIASATVNGIVYTQMAQTFLPQGGTIRFFDQAAIDPAADTVQIWVAYTKYVFVER